MYFPPLSPLFFVYLRRLWNALEGPNAQKVTRLCVLVIMFAVCVGAYWAYSTKLSIEGHLAQFDALRLQREIQIAELRTTMEDMMRAVTLLERRDERIADRVSMIEGRLAERGAPVPVPVAPAEHQSPAVVTHENRK